MVQENRVKLGKFTIPNYLKRVQLSKAQRPKYFEWDNITIKSGSKKLFQKCIKSENKNKIITNNGNVTPSDLKEPYAIVEFRGNKPYFIYENVLCNEFQFSLTNSQLKAKARNYVCDISLKNGKIDIERVIANPAQINKPKWHIIKGQDMYVGMNPFIRNKIVTKLKDSYYNVFKTYNKNTLTEITALLNHNFPLIIEMEICDTIKNQFDNTKEGYGKRWDVGNRADPYMKTFLDFLTNGYVDEYNNYLIEPIIPDDDRLHISSGNNAIFTPISSTAVPTIIFHIYKDNRDIWKHI